MSFHLKTLQSRNLIFKLLFRRMITLLPGHKPTFSETMPVPHRKRSITIRHVDCGSSNAAEQEIIAMFNPIYDIERYGFHLTASPRHADLLLVTGPLTRNMEGALLAAFYAMPEPRRVVTVGDGFRPEGIFEGSYAILPMPEQILPAWIAHIRGDPPSPQNILEFLAGLEF
jgi:Ni,Fe-hydrogenase III small subunit